MTSMKEILYAILNEVKTILAEYANDTKIVLKKKIRRLLIFGIVGAILLVLLISFIGSASLFWLIGSLKYLTMIMPAWQAWYVMAITSAVIGVFLLLLLYLLIRKQLKNT